RLREGEIHHRHRRVTKRQWPRVANDPDDLRGELVVSDRLSNRVRDAAGVTRRNRLADDRHPWRAVRIALGEFASTEKGDADSTEEAAPDIVHVELRRRRAEWPEMVSAALHTVGEEAARRDHGRGDAGDASGD